jgi:2,3-bisphosphoglycerate-independent phosphoglycerate mutase
MTKYILCLGDGMADWPIRRFSNETPLEVANTPNMDLMANRGLLGLVQTVPEGFEPGSDVANMSVMGYDPYKYYSGRAPLEAVSLGIDVPDGKIVFRCNLVNIEGGLMKDFSAGHISSEESFILMEELKAGFCDDEILFFAGTCYRNIVLLDQRYLGVVCEPPHNITDRKIESYLPTGNFSENIRSIYRKCHKILKASAVNKKREQKGLVPANNIWLWGQGNSPKWPLFKELYGLDGGVVTAVDLLKGIGKLAGLDVPNVDGATGFVDTNYEAKMTAAFRILENNDYVYIHIEAPDESGHMGDVDLKIKAIEDFDRKVVGKALDYQKEHGDTIVMVLPDHATPCITKTHSRESVPFVIYDAKDNNKFDRGYSEKAAKNGDVVFYDPGELMKCFLAQGDQGQKDR